MPPFRAPLVCAVAACLLSGAAAFAPGSSLPVLFGRASPAISGCLALRAAKKATNRPYFEQAPGTKIKRVRDKAGKAQKTAEDAAAIASKRQMEGVEIAVRQRYAWRCRSRGGVFLGHRWRSLDRLEPHGAP